MRIAIVSLQFEKTSTGGGGVHVESITRRFAEKGHHVTLFSIHTVKTSGTVKWKNDFDVPYSTENRPGLTLVRFLIENGIESPYAGGKDRELERIMLFAKTVLKWLGSRGGTFDVINLHGHHIIPGYMAGELKARKGARVFSYIHALETTYITGKGDFVGAYEGTGKVLARIREWEGMCRYADVVLVNSSMVRDELKDIIAGLEDEPGAYFDRIKIIASGCDDDFIVDDDGITERLSVKPAVIRLVTFCRIDPSKGIEYSVMGAKKAAEMSQYKFALTIAGIPASRGYLEKIKKIASDIPPNLSVEFRIFERMSTTEEKKDILDDKHIYVLPTLKEPFGMSIIEASARGDMIVSALTNGPQYMFESHKGTVTDWGIITDCGTLADITDDHTGYFADNIGKAIVWTVDNWGTCAGHVLNFNRKIREYWTWSGVAAQYLRLFSGETQPDI